MFYPPDKTKKNFFFIGEISIFLPFFFRFFVNFSFLKKN